MIKLFRTKRGIKTVPIIYWHNCDIPAKIFFEVMYSGDYSKLGTAPDVEQVFDKIFDEYYILSPNTQLKSWIQKHKRISAIRAAIAGITATISQLEFVPMNPEQMSRVVAILNNYSEVKPKFNTKDPIKEIARINNSIIGQLKNKLNQEIAGEKVKSEKIAYNFHKDRINLRLSLEGITIDENCSLYEWVEYVNAAKERHAAQKAAMSKNKTKK